MTPSFIEHMSHLPLPYVVFIPLIGVSFVCTLIIIAPQALEVYKLGCKARKRAKAVRIPLLYANTFVLLTLPIVVTFLKLVEVLVPVQEELAHFLCAVWEAYAFYCFLELILTYLDGPEGTLFSLANGPSVKIWAAPPLGCLCWCCCRPTRLDNRNFLRVKWLVYQFILIYPLIYLIDVMHTTDIKQLGIITLCSLAFCMYGLFVLLWSTEHVMIVLKTHRKFWAVKGILIMNTLILRIMEYIPEYFSVNWYMDNPDYDLVAPGAWAAVVTSVACVPLAFLSKFAYPVSEFHLIPVISTGLSGESRSRYLGYREQLVKKPLGEPNGDYSKLGQPMRLASADEPGGPPYVEEDISNLQNVVIKS